MKKVIIVLALGLIFLPLSACKADDLFNGDVVVEGTRKDICAEIQQMYDNKTLKDIIIGDPNENYQNSFFVDFDNDGADEELQYFSGRAMSYLGEIIDGERHGFPSSLFEVTAKISNQSIIKIKGEFLLLYLGYDGPYEVHRLIEMSEDEYTRTMQGSRATLPLYNRESICQFYNY